MEEFERFAWYSRTWWIRYSRYVVVVVVVVVSSQNSPIQLILTNTGIEGKLAACKYARESKKPFFGICLGFQCAVIEGARNLLKLKNASSTEFDKNTKEPVVMFMPEGSTTHMGGTMRLGLRRTVFQKRKGEDKSMVQLLHGGDDFVDERHRHRYEVNPEYVERLEKVGYRFIGKDETGKRMEVFERDRKEHPYFVGCQYHPELKSRPSSPSPNFFGLILAASGQLDEYLKTALTASEMKRVSSSTSFTM